MSSQKYQMCLFVNVILFSVMLFAFENARAASQADRSAFRCLYSFGDSSVDPGNNNYIMTKARSNFPPYGNNFPGKVATGRFSNGLLFTDYLAYYLGCPKYQRSYLGREFDYRDPVTAISFASAASGYDPDTAHKTKAIQMSQQVIYFKEYKARLRDIVGRIRANSQIKAALFNINAGTTDFALNHFQDYFKYFGEPKPSLPLQEYEQHLLRLIQRFIQELWVEGARKFAVNGLPPLGCIPIAITKLPPNPKNPKPGKNSGRKCLGYVNDISQEFNSLLQEKLQELESKLSETKIAYIDFEESLLNVIQNPDSYDFHEVNKGCCGTGLTEVGPLCNETSPLCIDASKYVFWDAAHPTGKTNEIIFTSNLPAIDEIIGN